MPHSSFVVSVAAVLHRPGARSHEHRSGAIPGLAVTSSGVPEGESIYVDVVLEAAEEGILATGEVSTSWSGECRRCLGPAGGRLSVQVRELFLAGGDPEVTYPLAGEHMDLEPMARDAVILELPLAPLCRPDCRGLCSSCGADLNKGPCSCPPQPLDPRWSALDALRGGELGSGS
jgi:uncharacterized protein